MGTLARLLATGLIGAAYSAASLILSLPATRVTAEVAGHQLDNSASGYSDTVLTNSAFHGAGLLLVGLALLLVLAVWWGPIARAAKSSGDIAGMFALALLGALALMPRPASAYFEKTDIAEAITILPNESFFWIPETGANKDTQAKLDSEDYLRSNKIPAKRFIIPHAKLSNSGGWGSWDFYTPTGRGIIVDRSPVSREWVAGEHRGTSKVDQSFPCQSKEGLDISVGISVGASVSEENSPKFLYRFGVKPPVVLNNDGKPYDRNDGHVIFVSAYYGRSLAEVMDDVGRKKIQTLVCREIADRTFDQANAEANKIADVVLKETTDWAAQVGITLDFLGWADTFTFHPDVQKAVNDKYAADKLGGVLPILSAIAQLKVQEGLGTGLDKHGLPIVVTPEMINTLVGLVRMPPAAPGAK